MSNDPRQWRRELVEGGWTEVTLTLYQAPCGCYFRGPYLAWTQMNGTHLANHIAAGSPPQHTAEHQE